MANKEVYFNEYCPKCAYKDVYEKDEPCDECLHHGWNEDSHKPVKFEEKK
jgi:hypothetical protein